jgi:riboflavin synthase
MFTGIVEEVGTLKAVRRAGDGARATLAARVVLEGLRPGDSVAVSGACVTAVTIGGGTFTCDLSGETLERTTLGRLRPGTPVNLERAALPTTRLGGHVVLGHVDGVGEVLGLDHTGAGADLRVRAPEALHPYLADKGSVAVDGISLTPFDVRDGCFRVAIIPTTLAETTLRLARPGTLVNLEADVMAKYARGEMRHAEAEADPAEGSGVTIDLLRRAGFLD